ncbi:MAG TPA: immunoglobulin-like domain-containing protein [Actinomycetota bacterium]|nr:immunoglobulin-like domain-containing protein [Actinomycetota bacterium]
MRVRPFLLLILALLASCTATGSRVSRPESERAMASFQVFPPTAPFGKAPRAILRNTGDIALEYEHELGVEMLIDGIWRSLQVPQDSELACDYPLRSLLLHPGDTRSQKVVVCRPGPPRALAPGTYRVTKEVSSIASSPDASAVEMTKSSEFRVAEPTGDVAPPSDCRVLCMSDTHVVAGQTVRVSFDPHERYTWGAASEVHSGTAATVTPIAYLVGWPDRDEKLTTFFVGEGGGVEDIGFGGPGEWKWSVPARLEPGIYSIAKDGIRPGVGRPLEDRTKTWVVSFEVEN